MYEVMHGDIRLTLNDAEAIAGAKRVESEVKRAVHRLDREEATIRITGNVKDLKRALKEAEAEQKKSLDKMDTLQAKREGLTGAQKGAVTRQIKAEESRLKVLNEQVTSLNAQHKHASDYLDTLKRTNAEASKGEQRQKAMEDGEKRLLALKQQEETATRRNAAAQDRADNQHASSLERERKLAARNAAIEADRPRQVAQLQREYDKAYQKVQRMEKRRSGLIGGKLREASSPVIRQRVELEQAHAVEEMLALRAKLEALGAKPIDIPTHTEGSNLLAKAADIGNIGTRLGPFSGTLAEFGKAALFLGPILTGLVGTVGALAGAIGTGLTGALGIAGAGAIGFGATFGGVFLALKPISTQFKEINKASNAYHQQVHKTGAESDKAKNKLKEFNHVTADLSPHARQAFLDLGNLNSEWKKLTHASRVSGMEAMAQGVDTLSLSLPMLARNTNIATKALSAGVTSWMRGLRSAEGQGIINQIMGNTNSAIKPLMSSLGHLGAALGRTAASFSRTFRPLLTDFDHWTASIDDATKNTDRMNSGVDNLTSSFRDVLGVTVAFGRVIKEVAAAAMGPGGGLMDDMAGGLNDLAKSIHDNPDPLKSFFGDSIQTTKALYDTLLPLTKLFLEFSTILRPATGAVLSLIGPIAELVRWFASLGKVRLLLQAWATMWLFKRGSAAVLGLITGSVNALAAAMTALGAATGRAGLSSMGAKLAGVGRGAKVAAAEGTAAAAVAEAGAVGRTGAIAGVPMRTPGMVPRATVQYGAPIGPAVQAERGIVQAGKMAKFGSALDALSVGLLGVSAPVAGIGIAAIGAAYGLKKLHDAADERDRQDAHIKAVTRVDPKSLYAPSRQDAINQARNRPGGTANYSSGDQTRTYEAERAELQKLAKDLTWIETLRARGGAQQRQLATTYSTYANAQLSVESAEKQYAAAVKASGKNSLEARSALQQLRDARRAESEAQKEWAKEASAAGATVARSLAAAQDAFNSTKGKPGNDEARRQLLKARDAAEAFTINLGRAKQGMDLFTGTASEEIGRFSRKWNDIKNVKKLLIQVDDQESAKKLAEAANKLKDLGHGGAARKILIDAKTPDEALARLEARLKDVERYRHAHVAADVKNAGHQLDGVLGKLDDIGAARPTAHPQIDKEDIFGDLKDINKELTDLNNRSIRPSVSIKLSLDEPKSTPTHGPTPLGDGWGYERGSITRAAKGAAMGYAKSHKSSLLDKLLGSGAGGLGNMPAAGSGLNTFNALATRFGLQVGSGLRPGAITSAGNVSYHSMGRARDFPGSPANMMKFAHYMAATFGSRLKELIYTPLGWSIKNGRKVAPYAQAEHYNHVHVAMAQGGQVSPGRYATPQVLFAEERGHPEYFISTNPRDKLRSHMLIAQAAQETGMTTFAKGGVGYSIKGQRPTLAQQSIVKTAMNVAKAVGASPKATKALLEAIFHESQAMNLKGGMGTSSGPLQVLAGTAKRMGISARNPRDVFEAFLTKGFTGKGSAMKLAKNSKLTAAMIAHMVQGNGIGGVGVYAQRGGEADSAMRWLMTQGGGGSRAAKPVEKPTLGASTTVGTKIAKHQAALAIAQRSSDPMNVYNAIMGKGGNQSISMEARSKRRRQAASLANDPDLGSAPGLAANRLTAHLPTEGLMEASLAEDRIKGRRIAKIDKALAPGKKLRKSTRDRLMEERIGLINDRSAGRDTRVDLAKQAKEAKFEASMGAGNKLATEYNTAMAESTTGLDDDIKAAEAEQKYYKARYEFAIKNKDPQGATDALNSYNTATKKVTDLGNQQAQDKLSANSALADLTPNMDDDLAASDALVKYWQGQLAIAQAAGDMPGIATAAGNIKTATDNSKGIKASMDQLPLDLASAGAALTTNLNDDVDAAKGLVDYWTGIYNSATGADKVTAGQNLAGATGTLKDATRNAELLPLQRDQAVAALTTSTDDDQAAIVKLRDYWQGQLDAANASGDIGGQIEAAGNLKGLNDDLQNMQGQVQQQMILLSDARRDLYKSFGTNAIQTLPSGYMVNNDNSSATHVTVNNNFQEPPADPHTWSKGVSYELQAAV